MRYLLLVTLIFFGPRLYSQEAVEYKVSPGKLHTKGSLVIKVLPNKDIFKVQMNYDIKKKSLVPVPEKFLNGKTVMEFPLEFKTEAGYKKLEQKKSMEIPKARLRFVKRESVGQLKDAYFLEVLPTNKKTKINLIYHPFIPGVGWMRVNIKFISKIPVLNGYKLEAERK